MPGGNLRGDFWRDELNFGASGQKTRDFSFADSSPAHNQTPTPAEFQEYGKQSHVSTSSHRAGDSLRRFLFALQTGPVRGDQAIVGWEALSSENWLWQRSAEARPSWARSRRGSFVARMCTACSP